MAFNWESATTCCNPGIKEGSGATTFTKPVAVDNITMSGICQRMGYSVAALTTFIVSFVMASWLMDVLIQGTGAW